MIPVHPWPVQPGQTVKAQSLPIWEAPAEAKASTEQKQAPRQEISPKGLRLALPVLEEVAAAEAKGADSLLAKELLHLVAGPAVAVAKVAVPVGPQDKAAQRARAAVQARGERQAAAAAEAPPQVSSPPTRGVMDAAPADMADTADPTAEGNLSPAAAANPLVADSNRAVVLPNKEAVVAAANTASRAKALADAEAASARPMQPSAHHLNTGAKGIPMPLAAKPEPARLSPGRQVAPAVWQEPVRLNPGRQAAPVVWQGPVRLSPGRQAAPAARL